MNQNCEIRARWIWCVDRPPIENAGLLIVDGHATLIDRPSAQAIDLWDVCIVPAFVNAHTHLEFSDLQNPIAYESTFASWIANVLAHRRKQHEAQPPSSFQSARRQTILQGLQESWRAGCATIVDMVTEPWSVEDIFASDRSLQNRSLHSLPNWESELTLFALPEVLGVVAERASRTLKFAQQVQANHHSEQSALAVRFGVSPHAPYSTPVGLVEQSVQLANQNNQLVSMHLAETREEIEFLEQGTGPLADMLSRFAPSPVTFVPRSIQDYLQILSTAKRSFVVHGNYLTAENIAFIQRHRDHMAVVYCPRTHAYFQHEPHPWIELLDQGIQVFLGTDSLASNPDLNILSEARFLFQQHPSADPNVLLSMITVRPETFLSSVSREALASPKTFAVVPCDARTSSEVGSSLLSGTEPAVPLSLQIQRRLQSN